MANQQDKANDQGTARAEQSQSRRGPGAPRYGADEIARRAYQRFLDRGSQHGHDMDDWFEAERELQAQGADESATPPHGDELPSAPEQIPDASRTAGARGKGPTRARKGVASPRPDRAADQQ